MLDVESIFILAAVFVWVRAATSNRGTYLHGFTPVDQRHPPVDPQTQVQHALAGVMHPDTAKEYEEAAKRHGSIKAAVRAGWKPS